MILNGTKTSSQINPNYILFTEHFFIGGADPYIVDKISSTKKESMDEILDMYEEGLLETHKEQEEREQLKKELKEELLQELKQK